VGSAALVPTIKWGARRIGDWHERLNTAAGKIGAEAEKVVEWRGIRLRAWGFAGVFLEVLAEAPQIPLEDIDRLMQGGCSPELAARIVL
jgi:hypothetical protein